MADEVYAFDENDARRIGRAVRKSEAGTAAPQMPTEQPRQRNYSRIPFRVDATETVPAYGLLRVTGMVEVDGRKVYKIDKPNTTFSRLYLVNGPDEITYRSGSTGYGWGTWLWHADYVLYDTGNTPAFGDSWGPQDGTWTIKKYRYGFTIMGGNAGTGAASRTIAVQSEVKEFWGQTDAAITKGSSGTISVYDGNDADTSINVSSVKNKFANVAITKKVKAHWLGGSWYLDAAEC
jgi:hypothetical protein